MRILLDPQIYWWQRYGGVSRYITEIYDYLSRLEGVSVDLPLLAHDNAYLDEKGIESQSAFFDFIRKMRFKGSDRIRQKLTFPHKRHCLKALDSGKHNLLVPSFYDPYCYNTSSKIPSVVTVHDMTHECFPELVPEPDRLIAEKRRCVEEASHIIAISEYTKENLIRFYPASEGKITVVYHGYSIDRSMVEEVELPEKYILFVGKRMAYKNLSFLAESVAPLLRSDPELRLICAGSPPFNDRELAQFQSLGIADKVSHMPITDGSLAAIYRRALCFVFPSLSEGFGFPILEAMACHCPVVIPRASCFPEIASDAALYYDTSEELAGIVEAFSKETIDRDALIQKGIARSEQFSWQKCAQETAELYRKVAG